MKVLLAVARYPWPPLRGDQLRTAQLVEHLAREHEVTLLAPSPSRPRGEVGGGPPGNLLGLRRLRLETYRPAGPVAKAAGLARALAGGEPLQSGLYRSRDLGRRLRRLTPEHDLGILQLVRLAGHAEDFGDLPLIVDLIDSLALNFERRGTFDRWWKRSVLRWEAARLERAEGRLIERAAVATVVCKRDRRAILEKGGTSEDRLRVVPLAIELEQAVPGKEAESGAAAPGGRPTLALTGNLGYFVNVDAVLWWLAEVWPTLRSLRPEVRLVIAGDRPAQRLRRAVPTAGGELYESPSDLRGILARADVALAPLRAGSGVPIKVLEAWSVGTPAVVSSWAAAGTEGRAGEHFLVADEPREWVEAIVSLLDEPAAAARLAAAGVERLEAGYSRKTVGERWREVLAKAGATAADRRTLSPDSCYGAE